MYVYEYTLTSEVIVVTILLDFLSFYTRKLYLYDTANLSFVECYFSKRKSYIYTYTYKNPGNPSQYTIIFSYSKNLYDKHTW